LLRQRLPPGATTTWVFSLSGPWAESLRVSAYAVAEDRLVALAGSDSTAVVVCWDVEEGDLQWSYAIPDLLLPFDVNPYKSGPICVEGGVVNLCVRHGPQEDMLALDLNTGRVLGRGRSGTEPRRMWIDREKTVLEHTTSTLILREYESGKEMWRLEAPPWRRFGFNLELSGKEILVPFERCLPYLVELAAEQRGEPWLRAAQNDRLTHGVMSVALQDGPLESTFGLDYERLPDAPRKDEPDFLWYPGAVNEPELGPIASDDLVIVPPVQVEWQDHWACAIAAFSRQSGHLLGVLWTELVPSDEWIPSAKLKMELDGTDLFLLTKDGRLWCFELPRSWVTTSAGE
jgi:hypothetical protein